MKNLKHIKLFEGFNSFLEAFNATHLNKVYNFIKSKDDKNKFSTFVKAIADQIDVPATAITDKYFEYLPYKDAIKKNVSLDLVDCKATSIQAFGDPSNRGGKGVPGDVCTGGKLKKSYGTVGRTREYDCPICNGTGKVSPSGQLKYLKFWLNSDGKLIGVTAVDGLYHANKSDINQFKQIDITEELKAALDRGRANIKSDLEEIEKKYGMVSGKTKLALDGITNYRWRDPRGTTIGTYWKDRDGKVYFASGNWLLDYKTERPVGVKWKEFGSYIAQLPYIFSAVPINMTSGTVKILTDVEEKEDYLYNVGVSFLGNDGFKLEDSLSKTFLSDAEFAIVFDFRQFEDDVISNKTKGLSVIKGQREESKKGVIGGKIGLADEDIKKANIERYTNAISNIDLTEGFTKLVNKLPRFFGGKYALYYILDERNFPGYRYTIEDLLKFMTAETDEQKKNSSKIISVRIKETFNSNNEFNQKLDIRFKKYIEYLNDKIVNADDDKRELFISQLHILNKLTELSDKIWKKISKMDVECVEDFEVIYSKINSIYQLMRSDRSGLWRQKGIYHITNIWNSSEPRRISDSFLSNYSAYYEKPENFEEYVKTTLDKIDYVSRVIERI